MVKGGPAGLPWVSDFLPGSPGSGGRHFCHLPPLDHSLPCCFWVSEQPAWVPKSWPGAGLNPTLSQGSPEALTLTAVVPTGTATHIPPASTLLMSLRWQVV